MKLNFIEREIMNDVEHDADIAKRDSDGGVTANNQAGQTEQDILDDAETEDTDGTGAEDITDTSYDVTFTSTIMVRASDADAAVREASGQWNSRQRFATDMLIAIVD